LAGWPISCRPAESAWMDGWEPTDAGCGWCCWVGGALLRR